MRFNHIKYFPKRLAAGILMALGCLSAFAADIQPGEEYYIWLNIYEKLIGSSESGDTPELSAYGTNADSDSYVFAAEKSSSDGYWLLRQKSSGRYLAASSANSWSMTFEQTASNENRFLWKLEEGTYTYLINKKSGSYLGVDGANKGKDYVGIYYDKPKGSHSQFSVIPANGTWAEARQAYESAVYTNAQGVEEIDYCQLNGRTIDRSDAVDIHITSNSDPILGASSVNLGSDRTWLVFDNILPSEVISAYLRYVTIGGSAARNGANCRVAIWLNGAVVIPVPADIMTCQGISGEFTLAVGSHTDLGNRSNTMTSFILRRGYMATVASGTKGGGHSRVYVADHADLEVTLPTALAKRVSSVYVKPWPYLSKKGWGSTSGGGRGKDLRASWFWSWSAGYSSTTDMEYVPCRQHLYWPSASEVNNKTATAALSINEPEHSEQHESSKCSCGGTISPWKAYTLTDDFKASGGRIGSPQPTDFSYFNWYNKDNGYLAYVDNMANRCDFAVTHAYWDISERSESSYASYFVNHCKEVWDTNGRPLWITELEIGSSWGESWSGYSDKYGTYRKYLQVLLQKMEECGWIERYCIYGFDNYWAWMFYEDGGITPAGQVYRDHRSTFAYDAKYTKTPTWWAPSAKTPSVDVSLNDGDHTLTFKVTNPNTDMTDRLIIERMNEAGEWETIYEEGDRWKFENESVTVTGIDATGLDWEQDYFRVTVVTLTGTTVSSSNVSGGYIKNPTIETDSKSSIDHWTCSRDAQNGYTKATGDTYFEVWHPTAAPISFNYYQDIEDELPAGIYRLSANIFNTTNSVEGATVNDAVGLYAQTTGQLYFAPVNRDCEIDNTYVTVIDSIVVTDGKLRVGVRNLGEMSARWAGADNFQLIRLGGLEEVDTDALRAAGQSKLYALMPQVEGADADEQGFVPRDASRFIVNPSCNNTSGYGWTTSNIDYDTANAFDGNTSNPYWNIWKGSAFNSSMSQDITGLPEGSYAASVLVRASATAELELSVKTANDLKATGTNGQGANAIDGTGLPSGWFVMRTDTITVTAGDTLTLALNVTLPGSGWWSADRFGLTLRHLPTEEEPLPGDVNEDGKVDINDVVAIINRMAGAATWRYADVNGDGKVDINDVVAVINRMAAG